MLRKLCSILIALSPLAFQGVAAARPVFPNPAAQGREAEAGGAERQAVERAIRQELGRATSTHVKVSQFKINSLEIESGWALAGVEPTGGAQLDPVSVLLRRRAGRWKVLTLGTSLQGTGRTYHVPAPLRRKWQL